MRTKRWTSSLPIRPFSDSREREGEKERGFLEHRNARIPEGPENTCRYSAHMETVVVYDGWWQKPRERNGGVSRRRKKGLGVRGCRGWFSLSFSLGRNRRFCVLTVKLDTSETHGGTVNEISLRCALLYIQDRLYIHEVVVLSLRE